MGQSRALIYLLRRDLRLADNPIFTAAAAAAAAGISHLIPLFVLSPAQYELSALAPAGQPYPFPEARSRLGRFWRCGPHRARFLAEALFDLKAALAASGSDLVVRAGRPERVVAQLVDHLAQAGVAVDAVWMCRDPAPEEAAEERAVARALPEGVKFRLFDDESTLVHRKDLPRPVSQLPDVFTQFRKFVEPLRSIARPPLSAPAALPPLPPSLPAQEPPFAIPDSLDALIALLQAPLLANPDVPPPAHPQDARSAHPFRGGESHAHARLRHLTSTRGTPASSAPAAHYKDTRNGLLGTDFSTKLAAYLAHGCLSARQIDAALRAFEDKHAGGREDRGCAAIRFELLWRDYMRFCLEKYRARFFRLSGFHSPSSSPSPKQAEEESEKWWKHPATDPAAHRALQRWLAGRTSTGLIDAAQRELLLTGYTSNRARQNAASFLARHLRLDWRLGAEWFESALVDYDVASNWGNWAYVAGVGNDPRSRSDNNSSGGGGAGRIFNPVKQAHDYDPEGEYIKTWVEETRGVKSVQCVWQPWKLPEAERKKRGIEDPLVKINWGNQPKDRRSK